MTKMKIEDAVSLVQLILWIGTSCCGCDQFFGKNMQIFSPCLEIKIYPVDGACHVQCLYSKGEQNRIPTHHKFI